MGDAGADANGTACLRSGGGWIQHLSAGGRARRRRTGSHARGAVVHAAINFFPTKEKGRAVSHASFRLPVLRNYCCWPEPGFGRELELCPVVSEEAGGVVLPRGVFAI